ncbi:uncharacterized protein RAG0_09325 [Rhynchosporium agropyri]|uniref:Uncharacterized protein n=1 Tax=Rhynchosporium agropyri TaxID=914238 RepID=A0A1E1KUZ1_9HELO|nr:uncharacterized protein RAG0_09325 [Rhynchosporium agropyri]
MSAFAIATLAFTLIWVSLLSLPGEEWLGGLGSVPRGQKLGSSAPLSINPFS